MSSVFRHGGSLPLPKLPSQSVQPRIPAFLYGTAWKKEKTTNLVLQALKAGFAGIDTAAQPKHYREDLVGEALSNFLAGNPSGPKREDIYVNDLLSAETPAVRNSAHKTCPRFKQSTRQ